MNPALKQLLSILSLQRVDNNLYIGESMLTEWGRVYGGQVLAQALSAAQQETESERDIHSFHSYFLRPGDPNKAIIYEVEATLDAGTISNRRVLAKQNGQPIFIMALSFQRKLEGFDHAASMSRAPDPDDVELEFAYSTDQMKMAPEDLLPKFIAHEAIDFRPVQKLGYDTPIKAEPKNQIWMKPRGVLPDDPTVHQYLLAFASDFLFLNVASLPHGLCFKSDDVRMATIDHSMWYHRELDFNDWLLYDIESPSASNGRGFVTGKIYDRKGRLVASATQEGIMRVKKKS